MAPKLSEQTAKQSPSGSPEARRSRSRRMSEGLVRSYVRPRSRGKDASGFSPSRIVEQLRTGLPIRELDDLQASLDVPLEKLAWMLGISKATLHRRRSGELLGTAESDRVVRFARLTGKAVEVFESEEHARAWLKSPQVGLGGETPLDFARTEVGAREVEDLLGRIEHGAYS